jgi:hypothetical protein
MRPYFCGLTCKSSPSDLLRDPMAALLATGKDGCGRRGRREIAPAQRQVCYLDIHAVACASGDLPGTASNLHGNDGPGHYLVERYSRRVATISHHGERIIVVEPGSGRVTVLYATFAILTLILAVVAVLAMVLRFGH